MFTQNETNNERIFGSPNDSPYVKDGIDRYVVHGETVRSTRPAPGPKAATHCRLTVGAGASATVRLQLTDTEAAGAFDGERAPFGSGFDAVISRRRAEADEFYDTGMPPGMSEDERRVVRQALAGMLWGKQHYYFDIERWLVEHRLDPLGVDPRIRNSGWFHMVSDDVLSMPDKWEYPWFAAWDLAFHTIALSMVDVGFAKRQLDLLLSRLYLHPNGQIPAYEWNFGDVNPPVHAWATLFIYELEKQRTGRADRQCLENCLPEADEELYVVAQSQGPRRPQCVSGRLSRVGQHWRVRPQRTAAHRRPPRPGRRHRLDGAVLPEHARIAIG